jgi:3-dehydroquinate synthase
MELTVNLGARSYPIVLDTAIAPSLPERLKSLFPKSTFGLVTNETVAKLYAPLIAKWQSKLSCVVHVMPDGEQFKTIASWSAILDTFLAARLERRSVIIALGGGVVGDVAGFAAATLLRGVPYIQVPTTLLAMVDSSVGGKTAVDHACGKNLIGAFHQPTMVLVDTAFLSTLPRREFLAGYAELFKYAFIGGRDMFNFVSVNNAALMENRDPQLLLDGIRRAVTIKAAVVEADERETGTARMALNFGHTFAHALEKHFGFAKLLHGEALWWGMRCACALGKLVKTIPVQDALLYEKLETMMPAAPLPSLPSVYDLHDAMLFDKKVTGGSIRFVLPAKAGTSIVMADIAAADVKAVLAAIFSKPR